MAKFCIIAGCSNRKRESSISLPAIDLYQGGCIPSLRNRLASGLCSNDDVFILSGKHGILRSRDKILPYDLKINEVASREQYVAIAEVLNREVFQLRRPDCLYVCVEPIYFSFLRGLLFQRDLVPIFWEPNLAHFDTSFDKFIATFNDT